MIITSVNYKQKFPTFQFLNCDIGFDGLLKEDEDPLEALKQLKTIAEAFHKQEFPHLYTDEMKGTAIRQVDPEETPQQSKEQQLLTIISMCTSVTALARFEKQVIELNSDEVNIAYKNKMEGLSK